MKPLNTLGAMLAIVSALTLGACASAPGTPRGTASAVEANRTSGVGRVQSIELVRQDERNGIGLGTVAGAVIGGVVGNQVGEGKGKTAATVIGAAGGAYAGNRIEDARRAPAEDAYRITVRMDNGETVALVQSTDAGLRIGDRAWVNNGYAKPY